MKLYAISDLHVGHKANASALRGIGRYADDWLILAGDVGETFDQLEHTIQVVTGRFARIVWVPGNHELWTVPGGSERGEYRYLQLVDLCRRYGVLTPEDAYETIEINGSRHLIVPLFLLYDYTFRPDHIPAALAVEWARQSGVLCSDEEFLDPDPFPSVAGWCAARCEQAEQRLRAVSSKHPTVLINHFPLRQELVWLPRIPRFSVWCGTRRTESWHRWFNAQVVVSGHLHIRRTDWIDGVRFEEVSLGYPRQWRAERGIDHYLREILPGSPQPAV